MRLRGLAILALVMWILALPRPCSGATEAALVTRYRQELKRIEVDLLVQRAKRKFTNSRNTLRRAAMSLHRGQRLSLSPPAIAAASARPVPAVRSPVALGPDVRVNDTSSDIAPASTQSEAALAVNGNDVLAAWNDGETVSSPGAVGWAVSRDGGVTWTDGGGLPVSDTLAVWESDPVVVADPDASVFHLVALAITTIPRASALASITGRFTGTGFEWGTPRVIRASRDTLPDKPWLAIDPGSGTLYVSYTAFFRRNDVTSDRIEMQVLRRDHETWSAPFIASPPEEDGLVQGSRPAVGPAGELHVAWTAVDTTLASRGLDHIRARTSTDGGVTFSPAVTVARYFSNFSSGAPGFNRGYGLSFPGIAIDRSNGPYRGRVAVTWSESLDFYDDTPSIPADSNRIVFGSPRSELFTVGDLLRSQIEPDLPANEFVFSGVAGETVLFYMDSLSANLDVGMRLLCLETEARNAFNQPSRGKPRFLLATIPATATYLLRVSQNTPAGGQYRIRTGYADHDDERGRDQRDVFTSWSDDGRTWSEPVRISDGPPRFDEWLPEIVFAGNGIAYAAWYDWRETETFPCRPLSQVYFARSLDGASTWTTLGALNTRSSDWSGTSSNLVPNQGDYIALAAHPTSVLAAWADARIRDPDIYVARHALAGEPAPLPRPRRLAITTVRPQPAAAGAWVECRLDPGARGRLDVHDLSGRRIESTEVVGGFGGAAQVRVEGTGLRPGIYLLRLVQGSESASARLAIVR